MNTVYLRQQHAPDETLGWVAPDGRVFESRPGSGKCIGQVDLATGKVYGTQSKPHNYFGMVELDRGEVYRHVSAALDKYVGRIGDDGKLYAHACLRSDLYVGRLDGRCEYALAGAAFLLLLLPTLEEK